MVLERDGESARAEMLRSRHYKELGRSSRINSLAEKNGTAHHAIQKGEWEAAKATLLDVKREADTIVERVRGRANSVGTTSIALRTRVALDLICRKQGLEKAKAKREVEIAQPDSETLKT
jgi:hypothetical protein